jgi:hypothetical protein
MATIAAAVPKSFNLFTSLPDDLIREVCEWDTTYRYVFSEQSFNESVLNAYWRRKYIQKKIKNEIYNTLESYQEKGSPFANRFLEMNFDDICDGTVYFVNQTEGMTPEEIDALQGKSNVCCDLRKETTIYFSLFQNVLRWVIIPKTFAYKAHTYFNRCEFNGYFKYLYDGMCTLEFDNVNTGRYSIYSKVGKVKPVLDACNIPLCTVTDTYYHQFNDPIKANILSIMSNKTLNSVIQGTSTRKFVLWM